MNARASEVDESIALGPQANSRSTGAIVSEGVLAGVVAASAVAVVFLLVDLAAGQAFRTPQQLGGMLLHLFGASAEASTDGTTALALYTLFHFMAFIAAGIVAASIVQVTMKQPVAILFFVILFFAFEVAFTGFVTFVGVQSSTTITPMQIAIGNVVASIAMAVFFRSRHPRLKHLGKALENEE